MLTTQDRPVCPYRASVRIASVGQATANAIASLPDEMARHCADRLGALLDRNLSISAERFRDLPYGEAEIPMPAFVFSVQSQRHRGLMWLSASLCYRMVGILMGDDDRMFAGSWSPSDAEFGLIERLALEVVHAFAEAGVLLNIDDLAPVMTEPRQWVRRMPSAMSVRVLRLAAQLDSQDESGSIGLIMQPEAFSRGVAGGRTSTDAPVLEEVLDEIPVTAIVPLGTISMSLNEVLSLKAGTMLPLRASQDDILPLMVGGEAYYYGRPGSLGNGHLALEITAPASRGKE